MVVSISQTDKCNILRKWCIDEKGDMFALAKTCWFHFKVVIFIQAVDNSMLHLFHFKLDSNLVSACAENYWGRWDSAKAEDCDNEYTAFYYFTYDQKKLKRLHKYFFFS